MDEGFNMADQTIEDILLEPFRNTLEIVGIGTPSTASSLPHFRKLKGTMPIIPLFPMNESKMRPAIITLGRVIQSPKCHSQNV